MNKASKAYSKIGRAVDIKYSHWRRQNRIAVESLPELTTELSDAQWWERLNLACTVWLNKRGKY